MPDISVTSLTREIERKLHVVETVKEKTQTTSHILQFARNKTHSNFQFPTSYLCLRRRKHSSFVPSILIFADIITERTHNNAVLDVELSLRFIFMWTEERRHFQCKSLLLLKIIINVESGCWCINATSKVGQVRSPWGWLYCRIDILFVGIGFSL